MERDVRGPAPQDRPPAPALQRPAAARVHADRHPGLSLAIAGPHPAAAAFEALRERARRDPSIVAFWLGGSRGRGRATANSDYDCTVILDDDAPPDLRREIVGLRQAGLDLAVMTFGAFERHAAWGSAEAWDRYSFAGLTAEIDKTGRVQPLIDAKGCVPAAQTAAFIDASLDHLVNQVYRALKCLRDGDPLASRLEAAEGVRPFLDALFALHGGRLRPYYKYLALELESRPLRELPYDGEALLARLDAVHGSAAALALRGLLADTHGLFRRAGHGAIFDAWGDAMAWTLSWAPPSLAAGT